MSTQWGYVLDAQMGSQVLISISGLCPGLVEVIAKYDDRFKREKQCPGTASCFWCQGCTHQTIPNLSKEGLFFVIYFFSFCGFCFCCVSASADFLLFCFCFSASAAFVDFLLLLLFCFCCFSAFCVFVFLLFAFVAFLLWQLFSFLLFFAFPFLCFLTFGSGVLLGGALCPPNPPRHEICTSSPTPAPATKSIF